MNPNIRSREKWAMLKTLWMSAQEPPNYEHLIETPTPQTARTMRAELYRAVRRAQTALHSDPELLTIAAKCSITIPAGSSNVLIYSRETNPVLVKAFRASKDKEADSSLARLMGQLGEDNPELKSEIFTTPPLHDPTKKPNPYF